MATLPTHVTNKIEIAPPKVPTLDAILADRGSEYGPFENQAKIVQLLKAVMHREDGWGRLAPDQKEAAEMIVHKLGRILNGNPNNEDSWRDIAGYAQLVADRVKNLPK